MFQQLKNIDTAFKHIKLFSYLLIVANVITLCFGTYKSYEFADKAQDRVHILYNGKVLEALAADRKDNIPVEARDHIRMFHYYFFTLDPDEKVIKANITKALYMADNSADKLYNNLKEQGYYADLISGNISQQISIDSIIVDVNQKPYYFRCYAKEKLVRSTSIVTRSLITEGYLRTVDYSDNNPHGFLIERWNILENKDINTENR